MRNPWKWVCCVVATTILLLAVSWMHAADLDLDAARSGSTAASQGLANSSAATFPAASGRGALEIADGTTTHMIRHHYLTLPLEAFTGNPSGDEPTVPSATCELALLYTGTCGIETLVEDYLQCVLRLGPHRIQSHLPSKCTQTTFFRNLIEQEMRVVSRAHRQRDWIRRGIFERAQIWTDLGKPRYVPPAQRPYAKYGASRLCGDGCIHHPISFAIPAANIVEHVSRVKIWDFAPFVPRRFPLGDRHHYHFSYNDEWLSHTLQRHSMFAFTHRRGGWDCMRHLEILSAGAIPYFADIGNCPNNSLTTLPKSLILKAMMLPAVAHVGRVVGAGAFHNAYMERFDGGTVNFKKPGTVEGFNSSAAASTMKKYFRLAEEILAHTKAHMTTQGLAAYILRVMRHEEARSVLLIGPGATDGIDYMHLSVEHGFAELGVDTTVFGGPPNFVERLIQTELNRSADLFVDPVLNGVTTAELEQHRLRSLRPLHPVTARAWQYGFREPPFVVERVRHSPTTVARLRSRISRREFDLVIYTFLHHDDSLSHQPFWDVVKKHYSHSEIAFINHNDNVFGDPDAASMTACRFGFLFKREMHDVPC